MNAITIAKTDYLQHSGINLDLEFLSGTLDDGTSGAEKFLKNLSIDMWDYLKSHYQFDEALFEKMTQQDVNIVTRYKRALCLQVDYVLKSGDAMANHEVMNSGVREISPRAYQIFKMLGLCNLQPAQDMFRRH